MRLVLVAAITFAWVLVAHADAPGGFDHNVHERDVFTHGQAPMACVACHPMQNGLLVGRPDHGACFGACHGPAPAKFKRGTGPALDEAQLRVCANCHAPSSLAAPTRRPAVAYPPYVATDFSLAANHKAHAPTPCTQCHPSMNAAAPPRTTPHRRCLACHDGTRTFAMTTCQPCHTPGSGTPLPTKLAAPNNTVTSTFSHPRHAVRGGKGAQCTTCHASIAQTTEFILPRTPAQACAVAGCHDGAPVFSITVACTRCHTTAPTKFDMEPPTTRFSHATHQPSGLACATCHVASKANEVNTVGHAPCVACHAEDFSARTPRYCGACHNSTEPWRKLTVDRGPADRTEFGATIDHTRPAHQRACATCHSLTTSASQLRPARGHVACTGTTCHATTGGAAPMLTACESCHQRDLVTNRTAERIAAPWSVRATFDHAKHTRVADGSNLPCASCHTDLRGPSPGQLATPAKITCRPCHDGTVAFKLTGTTCTRCHPGS